MTPLAPGNREAVHKRPDGQPCGLRLPDLAGPATRKRALKAVEVVEGSVGVGGLMELEGHGLGGLGGLMGDPWGEPWRGWASGGKRLTGNLSKSARTVLKR